MYTALLFLLMAFSLEGIFGRSIKDPECEPGWELDEETGLCVEDREAKLEECANGVDKNGECKPARRRRSTDDGSADDCEEGWKLDYETGLCIEIRKPRLVCPHGVDKETGECKTERRRRSTTCPNGKDADGECRKPRLVCPHGVDKETGECKTERRRRSTLATEWHYGKVSTVKLDKKTAKLYYRCHDESVDGIDGHHCEKIEGKEVKKPLLWKAHCEREQRGDSVVSLCGFEGGADDVVCRRKIQGWFCYSEGEDGEGGDHNDEDCLAAAFDAEDQAVTN